MRFGTRWPPVPAGILIGISMLLAFVVAGRGIGASGAMTRLVAWVQHGLFPVATEQSAYFGKYFADGAHPLNDYVVFLLVGLLIGRSKDDLVVLHIGDDGALNLNFEDDIVAGTCVTKEGEIVHEKIKAAYQS